MPPASEIGAARSQVRLKLSKPELRWRAAVDRLEGAYSEHTIRAYKADFTVFEHWCRKSGKRFLPATSDVLVEFVTAGAITSMPTTLIRRLASIKKIHRLLRLPHQVDDEEVMLSLRRALRNNSRRRKQAHGLTGDLRDMMIAACPETLLGLRNRAFIAIGYDTLCRRSELVALRVEDLCELKGGAMSILVRRGKADPFGDGRFSYLTPKTVKILRAWLDASGVTDSWIFRRVYSKRVGVSCLHPFTVSRMIKELAVAAGMDQVVATKLSGHSMRVGAAQDMMAHGIGILPIMQAGGWQSLNNLARYIAHVSVTQNGIAQLYRNQASAKPTRRTGESMPALSKNPRTAR